MVTQIDIIQLATPTVIAAAIARAEAARDAAQAFAAQASVAGKSAYEVWLDAGNTGTVEEYLASLVGAPGTTAGLVGTSTTAVTFGTGTKTLTTQAGLAFVVGVYVRVASTVSPSSFMSGPVTGYSSTTGALNVEVDAFNGSGSATSWSVSPTGPSGPSGTQSGTRYLPTTQLPAPNTVNAGYDVIDSTRKKYLWSDGSAYLDAMGVVVQAPPVEPPPPNTDPGVDAFINDTAFTFTGTGWQTGADTENFQSDDHYASVAGNVFTYTASFVAGGTFELRGKKAPHHGIVSVKVDNGTPVDADGYDPVEKWQQTLWTSPALTAGSHTFTGTVSGTKNSASSGTVVSVDELVLRKAVTGTGSTPDPTPDPPPPPAATGFFTRVGQSVQLNGVAWRGTGVNLPWSMGCGAEVSLTPTLAEHTTMFSRAKPNSIYRIWMFGGANLTGFDAILNAARPYGHRFVPVLSDWMNGCGEPYCGPNPSGFLSGGWNNMAAWKGWLTTVVNRYKAEPLIGWWEWINEPGLSSTLLTFFDQVGAYVRNTLGDTHLIGTGTMSEYGNSANMRLVNGSAYIDVCSMHEYDQTQAPSAWTSKDAADAAAVGKPFWVGESGINPSQYAAGTARANQIKAKISALSSQFPTCVGYCYWSGAASFTQGDRMEIDIVNSAEITAINTTPF